METEAAEGAAAAAAAPARQPRRGPAPIASFDHDGSDEVRLDSSPESKQTFRLPEIREHPVAASGDWLSAGGEGRARSHSTPAVGALPAPTPRIDISRASSSSHHDSRDSSPELALFAGDAAEDQGQRLELGFREDGALDLRSSTEELSFLEPAPSEPRKAQSPKPPAAAAVPPPPAPPAPPPDRRHSRKDSQSSEAALLGVSGRTSRLSSVGSACSAQSAISRVSRLSVVSGASRSPSPHRMLLETSFCGPKPIETDPEACAAAVAEHILEIAKMSGSSSAVPDSAPTSPPAPAPAPATVDARDRREVRTEATVEAARSPPASAVPRSTRQPALALSPVMAPAPKAPEPEKPEKESKNRARSEERKARPRVRREPSEPEVYKSGNRSKDIIRIKLRPDDQEEEDEGSSSAARKPGSLALGTPAAPATRAPSPALSRRRSPSPPGPPSVSRKSSFCSLFKSRETIASPDSPQAQEALRRKRSLTDGRARSKSRDRSATPTSSKIRGSVLSLFRTPRKSAASSSPGSRATSPAPAAAIHHPSGPSDPRRAQQDKLKYYEEAKNGIIHIPLRTPPEERSGPESARRSSGAEAGPSGVAVTVSTEAPRPASAPQQRDFAPASSAAPLRSTSTVPPRAAPIQRTVLPDGSIIIPLRSPTERVAEITFSNPTETKEPTPAPPEPRQTSRRDDIEIAPSRVESSATSLSSTEAAGEAAPREPQSRAKEPLVSPPELPASAPAPEVTSKRRKERLVFTTHVGSREQVFSTQFSITKTPSVTSEISGSFPSFDNGELRDTHIAADPPAETPVAAGGGSFAGSGSITAASASGSGAVTPQDPPRDSSESEPSSEAAPPQAGNDVERRGLVVQESFEEELPYIPTTLPQERSMAVPMVPVRERGGVLVRSVQRPRAAPPAAPRTAPPPPEPAPAPPPSDKLRIKLPRRPRVSSASSAPPPLPRPSRERTRSGGGGDSSGGENRAKQEWIDFEEVPERRKQPKRIQTLPVGTAEADCTSAGVVFSYVEPEHCRCECHAHARADDQLPLLSDDMQHSRISSSSAECGEEEAGAGAGAEGTRRLPFTTDLDLRHDAHAHTEARGARP